MQLFPSAEIPVRVLAKYVPALDRFLPPEVLEDDRYLVRFVLSSMEFGYKGDRWSIPVPISPYR